MPPCRLLQLPRELRDEIWITVLSSTRLAYRNDDFYRQLKPPPFSLSLLRVCRQINEETKPLWLNHVLFHFEDPETLLDILAPLPLETISQIRHLRLVDDALLLHPQGNRDEDVRYRAAAVFMLLPGLRLKKLTVFGRPSPGFQEVAYDTLRGLVEEGNGWEELHYVMPHSGILGYASERVLEYSPKYLRKPQPADFIEKLIRRDGADSGASVTIYRSTISDVPDAVMNPLTREVIDQKIQPSTDLDTYGLQEDKEFTSEKKALLVIVKRGRNANVSEPVGPPYSPEDIREWAQDLPWPKIREISHSWKEEIYREEEEARARDAVNYNSDGEEIPGSPESTSEDWYETDSYKCVDEFDWTGRL